MRNLFDLANVLIAHGSSLDYLSEIGERGNAMGELLFLLAHRQTFYAVKFLVEHPRVSVPFIVSPRSSDCVFHAICRTMEVRRNGMAAADFLPLFRLLRHKFPKDKPHQLPKLLRADTAAQRCVSRVSGGGGGVVG